MRNVDALQTHFALLADRDGMDLGTNGGVAARLSPALLEGDGPRHAFRQRRAPARHLRGGVQRLYHVGLVGKVGAGDQLAAIKVWVLAGRVGKLIHEAFAIEIVGRSAYAAPRANGNVKGRGVGREAIIGRVVTRGGVEGGDSTWGFLVHGCSDFESDRPAIAIQSGAQASYAHGPISGADEVFLARPQQVDRSAAVLVGEVDRLFGLRAVAIAAEAAAEVAHVEIDVLFRNAGDLRGREARLLGALVTDPNVHPVVSDKHCRVT